LKFGCNGLEFGVYIALGCDELKISNTTRAAGGGLGSLIVSWIWSFAAEGLGLVILLWFFVFDFWLWIRLWILGCGFGG